MAPQKPETDHNRRILERIIHVKRSMRDNSKEPLDLHELAVLYYELENYRQAASYLEKLTRNYPDYIELAAVYTLRALCLILSGQYQEAEAILVQRIKHDALDTRLQAMLAYIYEKTQRSQEAIKCLQKILKLQPENTNALNSFGYLLGLYGKTPNDKKLAFACLAKALRSHSDNPAYLDSLGVYYAVTGDQTRARQALYRALQQAPENSEILEHLSKYL